MLRILGKYGLSAQNYTCVIAYRDAHNNLNTRFSNTFVYLYNKFDISCGIHIHL